MKKFLFLMAFVAMSAVARQVTPKKYLAGGVPTNKYGVVVFRKDFKVPDANEAKLFSAARKYISANLMHGKDALSQSHFLSVDSAKETIAARISEYLYFKKTAWVTHRVKFSYDIVFRVQKNGYAVQMQGLKYSYEPQEAPGGQTEIMKAEDWITDKEALNSKGCLTGLGGKMRRFTIDRVDQIFNQSYRFLSQF